MKTWSFARAETGEFVGVRYSGPEHGLAVNTPDGCVPVDGEHHHVTRRLDVKTGGVVRCRPDAPDASPLVEWTWDDVAEVWQSSPTLEGIRMAKWEALKAARAAAAEAPIEVDGRVYDCDEKSQIRIAGAVRLAQLAPAGWSIDWTLADNSVATLSAADLIAVGVAVGARTDAVYAVGRQLRAQLALATDAEQVAAVVWPGG